MIRRQLYWDLIYTLLKKIVFDQMIGQWMYFLQQVIKGAALHVFRLQARSFMGTNDCRLVVCLCVENIKIKSFYWLFVEHTHLLKIKCIFQELHTQHMTQIQLYPELMYRRQSYLLSDISDFYRGSRNSFLICEYNCASRKTNSLNGRHVFSC